VPVVLSDFKFVAVSIFNDKLVEVVIVACFACNAVCNPFVLLIVKLPSVMVACLVEIFAVFKSLLSCKFVNEDCKFKILEIVKSLSFIIFCFKSILSCKFVNEDCKFKILGIF
jgi:hypothetical protein